MGTNTGLGIGIGIPFKNFSSGGRQPLPPDLKASLKGVWIAYGKSNNDADRSIVKNLVDPDNPFVISNAAYTEGSGYADKDSPYYGAFVTDGVEDLITSTKTVQDMLGGSNEITVVSMAHFIKGESGAPKICRINQIRRETRSIRTSILEIGKSGIFGYTYKNGVTTINNILGDKNDCIAEGNLDGIVAPFSVEGYYYNNNSNPLELCSIAWYWTVIANKVLTTDQINQVIAYFNLDRTLKPDILCNITKQGITNDNHADFNDKLIDYSGNGRDIQMNNLAWKGGSGIAAKPFETIKDYTILSDEARQELTIYNEFSYKVKSNTPNHYWVVQSIIKDNTSYQVTIITDKDCYWINSTSFINNKGNKESIRKEYPVKANTPTQVIICGLNEFEYPEGIKPTTAVSYVNLSYAGEITVTFIPSYKGGLLLDGVNDFGQFVGDLGLKDYTLIMNRAYNNLINNQVPLISSNIVEDQTPFIVEHWNTGSNAISFSYGASCTTDIPLDINKKIVYQSTYSYMGYVIPKGNAISTGSGITLGKFGNGVQYSAICLWSLMLFPYSMSEFLIERQLKKHKLGTLYPDMVEFRPVIKTNVDYTLIQFYINNYTKRIYSGDYIPINTPIEVNFYLKNNVDELISFKVNGNDSTFKRSTLVDNAYNIRTLPITKSPQKIDITIDEYIRYEDIVQPYPVLLRFKDENGNEVSWGGKFKVGSTITRIGSIADPESNLLNGLYSISGLSLNGKGVTSSTSIVEKQMVFKTIATYLLDNNEPKCILSPRLLRIPNSSYKILGYIPDISGHGNNGVIHNSAYAEGSGVNEDGSYQFDGVDDFVTIPTVTGGKQVLMKVNWQSGVGSAILYDQRLNLPDYEFAIYNGTRSLDDNPVMAYQARNNGQTYIDGILNSNIMASELRYITHNITITNELSLGTNNTYPVIGSTRSNTYFAQMYLYDFMLFDNISTDDKIKELNEYVGIEAKVEKPDYYWDAYGKTNLDKDRDSIKQRGVAVGDYDLTNTNFAYDKMSGFGGYEFTKFDNTSEWTNRNRKDGIEIIKKNGYSFTAKRIGTGQYFYDFQNRSTTVLNKSLTVKAVSNNNTCIRWEYKYRTAKKPDIDSTLLLVRQAMIPNVSITVALPYKTEQEKADLGVTEGSDSYLFYFDPSDIPVGEEYTVEMLPLYPNGLLYDAVTDYSENVNIPVFTDFTAIMKRKWLKNQGCPLIKGSKVYEGGNGNALLFEWDKAYNFVFYKRTDIMEGKVPENISFITPTNYNGNVITRGSGQDTNGICIAGDGNAGFANIVFYKLILYPKTIPLLQINFLKNLMERDEIIDLNNPIFIKNE